MNYIKRELESGDTQKSFKWIRGKTNLNWDKTRKGVCDCAPYSRFPWPSKSLLDASTHHYEMLCLSVSHGQNGLGNASNQERLRVDSFHIWCISESKKERKHIMFFFFFCKLILISAIVKAFYSQSKPPESEMSF